MHPEFAAQLAQRELDSAIARGWTVEMMNNAKEVASRMILDRGHKVCSVDFLDCGSGAVRATSQKTLRNSWNHPAVVATIYRDGSSIVR